MFSFIYVWINGWVNSREAGDMRRYRAHYDVTAMATMIKAGLINRLKTACLWIIANTGHDIHSITMMIMT